MTEADNLTKHASGSVREVFFVSWPLILSLLFSCLMLMCDRIFLCRYSLDALGAYASTVSLVTFFQISCVYISSISQAYVGQYKGARTPLVIGKGIWQMVWFSLLSTIITMPISLYTARYFFGNSPVKELGMTYFVPLMWANFLFPLGATLASFFTGQGRTSVVSFAMVASLALHFVLDGTLIFGISNMVPALGILGAASATIASQTFYCVLLFVLFMRKQERRLYGTNCWRLEGSLLLHYFIVGAPRALSKLINFSAWVLIVGILTQRGGDYLLVLSISGSLYILFSCLTEGMGQGLITIVSYLIGKEKLNEIPAVAKSAFLFLFCIQGFLSIFLLIYPEWTVRFFFTSLLSQEQLRLIALSCYGLWIFFLMDGIKYIGFGILTAFRDTTFLMVFSALAMWPASFLPTYIGISLMNLTPDILWWLTGICNIVASVGYAFRIRNKLVSPRPPAPIYAER